MAGIEIRMERRQAVYRPPCNRPELGLEKGEPYACEVHGCYQVTEDGEAYPYFVIELYDGRCTYASIECVQFTDWSVE